MDWRIVLLGIALYLAVVFGLMFTPEDWLAASSERELFFRRPWSARAGTGMLALPLLAGAVLGATALAPGFGLWFTWGWFVPGCLLSGGLLLLAAGPKAVRIDLDERKCRWKRGWAFCLQERVCPLSEASHLRVFSGGHGNYVVLWVGGPKDPMFMLSTVATKSAAKSQAQTLAARLQLPVRDLMRQT